MTTELIHTASTSGFLDWSVKQSFWEYVVGAGGTITAIEPAQLVGPSVRFLQGLGSPGQEAHFVGGVVFSAHHGVLSVAFREPRLEACTNGDVVLSVRVADTQVRWAIASVDPATGHVLLTVEGAVLLGSHYRPGTELAPLRFG